MLGQGFATIVLGCGELGGQLTGAELNRQVRGGVRQVTHRHAQIKQGLTGRGLQVNQVAGAGGGLAFGLGGGAGLDAGSGTLDLQLVEVQIGVAAAHGELVLTASNADVDQPRTEGQVQSGLDQFGLIRRRMAGAAITQRRGAHGQGTGLTRNRCKRDLAQIGFVRRLAAQVDGEGAPALAVRAIAHLGAGNVRVLEQFLADFLGVEFRVARIDDLGRGPVADLERKALINVRLGDRQLLLFLSGRTDGQDRNRIGDLAFAQSQLEAALGAQTQLGVDAQIERLHLVDCIGSGQRIFCSHPGHALFHHCLGRRIGLIATVAGFGLHHRVAFLQIQVQEGQLQAQLVEQRGTQLDVGHILLHALGCEVAQVQLEGAQFHRRGRIFAFGRLFVVDEVTQNVLERLGQLVHHLEDAELHVALARVFLVGLEAKELDTQLVSHRLHRLGQRQGLLDVQAQQARRYRRVVEPHLAGHGLEHLDELLDKRHARANVGQLQLGQGNQHRIFVRAHGSDERLHQPVHALGQDLRQAELDQLGRQLAQWNFRIDGDAEDLAADGRIGNFVALWDDLNQQLKSVVDRIQVGQVDLDRLVTGRGQQALERLSVELIAGQQQINRRIEVNARQAGLDRCERLVNVVGVFLGRLITQRGTKADGQLLAQNRRLEAG